MKNRDGRLYMYDILLHCVYNGYMKEGYNLRMIVLAWEEKLKNYGMYQRTIEQKKEIMWGRDND